MGEHTKGRLVVHDYQIAVGSHNKGLHIGPTGLAIFIAIGAFDEPTVGKTAEANARRLVACWNAWEDTPTAVIEESNNRPLADIVRDRDDARSLAKQSAELAATLAVENEELVAALRGCEAVLTAAYAQRGSDNGFPEMSAAELGKMWLGVTENARALLAKHAKTETTE